jgi:hypothetical protein
MKTTQIVENGLGRAKLMQREACLAITVFLLTIFVIHSDSLHCSHSSRKVSLSDVIVNVIIG